MKFFNIFKRGPTIQNQGYSISELNEFFNSEKFNADISNNRLNSATYFACMQIRCNAIAKLPLKIYRDKGKGKEKASDHYLYDLVKLRPNAYMSMHDFMFALEFSVLEYGDAFIYQEVKKGKIQGLYLLDANSVTIYVDNAGLIGKSNALWYVWRDKTGKEYKLDPMEVCHIKNFSKDGIKGTPIKTYLAETIENEQYGNKFLNNHYKNGLSGGAVLNYTAELNDNKASLVRQKFEQMTSGIKNAGRIIPIPLGFQLNPIQRKLIDDDFFNLQGLTIRHIANAFGVKLFQLNDLDRSTYVNVESQNRAFYSETLQNELTKIEQEFDYKILTSFDRKDGYYTKFNVDAILRSDFETRMKGYSIAIQNGIMSLDEVRDKEELVYKDGTEILMCNGNMIPVTQVGNQYLKGGDNGE